jgi:Mn2+/Fe2+ NRAMP family transporter
VKVSALCLIVFPLLLCNDREVLGPLVNPRWLNVLAARAMRLALGTG